jgi:hypothetical protein
LTEQSVEHIIASSATQQESKMEVIELEVYVVVDNIPEVQ